MSFLRCTGQIDAHGRSQISKIVKGNSAQELLSIAQDGFLKVWNIRNLELIKTIKIGSAYLTGLYANGEYYLVGNGKGELLKFDNDYNLEAKYALHQDCLTEIVAVGQYIITAGADGKLIFLDKNTLTVVKKLYFETPLTEIRHFGDYLYLAGNPAYKLNLQNFETVQMERIEQFCIFRGKLYGCSDQNGLVGMGEELDFELPCQFMVPLQQELMVVSEESITLIGYPESLRWKSARAKEISPGYAIKAAVVTEDCVFLGGEEGKIIRYSWVQAASPQAL